MNVNIDTADNLRRKLTIEVEPDEIKRELDRAFNELKRGVVLKGFRPGRAPRKLLERFFGDQVRGEVIQKLVKEYTDKALSENDLKPVVPPEIVTEELRQRAGIEIRQTAHRLEATRDHQCPLRRRGHQMVAGCRRQLVGQHSLDRFGWREPHQHRVLAFADAHGLAEQEQQLSGASRAQPLTLL